MGKPRVEESGTFTGTGTSQWVRGMELDVALNFLGTASVDIEQRMPDGDAVKIETGLTADVVKVVEFGTEGAIRLTCTAHTNNVEWSIKAS